MPRAIEDYDHPGHILSGGLHCQTECGDVDLKQYVEPSHGGVLKLVKRHSVLLAGKVRRPWGDKDCFYAGCNSLLHALVGNAVHIGE